MMYMATAVSERKKLDEIRAVGWQDQGGSFWRPRVAEGVCDNVECGEEGVLKSSMRVGSYPLRIG